MYSPNYNRQNKEINMDNNDIIRIHINGDEEDIEEAQKALNDNFIDWDYDSGDRMMIPSDQYQEASEILDELGIDYDVI